MRVLGPTRVEVGGRVLTSFAGTGYLGLSFHPRVLAALAQAARDSGFGLGTSRKTTGSTDEVLELERDAAEFCGAEDAIVTTSGTLANAGVIDGLRGVVEHWVIDEACHTSFRAFLPMSGAATHTYRHLDAGDAARVLSGLTGKAALFTDAVFPLTGAVAPLREIVRISGESLLVFDEAHSMAVVGPSLVAKWGLHSPRTLITATFTKALGCAGGMILGASGWIEEIRERSAILASTSALPPSLARTASVALHVVRDEPERLERLHSHVRLMRELLGWPPADPAVPIFHTTRAGSELSEKARTAGYLVPIVSGYPGSPTGGMLRWTVSSEHSEAEIRTISGILGRL